MLYDPKWEEKVEVKLEPWQEILLKAADLIESRGWTRGRFENASGNLCMLGAMRVAVYGMIGAVCPKPKELIMANNKLTGFLGCHVSLWNDRRAGSTEEVAAKLREVAYAI